jgi:hypothetical protein
VDFYPWIVFVHVVAAFGFAFSHGASAFVAFRIRAERDPLKVRALLELSTMTLGTMYVSFLVLLVAGIAAGIMGGWFAMGWIWAAIGVLFAVSVAMYLLATRYYGSLRLAVGLEAYGAPKGVQPGAASAEELGRLLDTRRPEAIAAVGIIGLVVILWLMVLKPF